MSRLQKTDLLNIQSMNMTKKTLGGTNVRLTNLRKLLKVFTFLLFILNSLHMLAEDNPPNKKANAGKQFAKSELVSENRSFTPRNDFNVPADTTIRGRILDSVGAPLAGVSVVISGTDRGTVTNASGDFVLNGVPAGATLLISNVGYQSRQVSLRPGQTT